jgi:hypothetical protein
VPVTFQHFVFGLSSVAEPPGYLKIVLFPTPVSSLPRT